MELYLDVIMFQNFIINLFLLIITFKLMKIKVSKKKMMLASLIGTLYTLTMIFPKVIFFSKIPFQLLVAFIMVKSAWGKCSLKEALKGAITFITFSVLLAGLCFKISQLSVEFNFFSEVIKSDVSIINLLVSLIIVYIVTSILYEYFKDRAIIDNLIYDVEITFNKNKYNFKAFLDTGNSLVEPVTKLPCIIVEDKYINCFNEEINNNYYRIPYKAVGYSGYLKGYKSDSIRIKKEHGKWKSIQAMICPYNQILSSCKDYNALLSRGII